MGILYICITWEMSTFSNYNNPQSNELVVKFPNEIHLKKCAFPLNKAEY